MKEGAPRIVVHPQVLPIPTGQRGEFTVALSDDPGGQIVLSVSCIGGGCGFAVLDVPLLYFDSSNFAEPQTVVLIDTGFRGRGQSVFQVTGDIFDPVSVLIIRD